MTFNEIYKTKAGKIIIIGSAVVLTIIAIRLGWKLYNRIGNRPNVPNDGNLLDIGGIAGEIYDAFYRNDMFGWSEDEARAIEALRKVPDANIDKLANIYNELYKKSLKEDFIKYLSEEEYKLVADKFV